MLSTGGGTPCYSGNMELMLKETSNIFYLNIPIPELHRRLGAEKEARPVIKHIADEDLVEFIGKHLFERGTYYAKATHTLFCGTQTPQEIASTILEKLC